MNRSRVSNPEMAQLGAFRGRIEWNDNFKNQAFGHNLGRNNRVVELFSYLALLRQAGEPLSGNIACLAAIKQNSSAQRAGTHMGHPTGPMDAAHFLPGQLRIGGRPVWEQARNREVRDRIEYLFAEVEHLALPFNQADTEAEAKGDPGGLCDALVKGCRTLIGRAVVPSQHVGRMPLDLLEAAYNDWHTTAVKALEDAKIRKETREGLPPLVGDQFSGYTAESIAARCQASDTQHNRENAARILGYYTEDQQVQRTWNWVVTGCQPILREAEERSA